jgi:hypothetical protein
MNAIQMNKLSSDKLFAVRQAVKEIHLRNQKAQNGEGKKESIRDLAMIVYTR